MRRRDAGASARDFLSIDCSRVARSRVFSALDASSRCRGVPTPSAVVRVSHRRRLSRAKEPRLVSLLEVEQTHVARRKKAAAQCSRQSPRQGSEGHAGKQGVRASFGRTVASPMSSPIDRRLPMKSFLLAVVCSFPILGFAAVPTTFGRHRSSGGRGLYEHRRTASIPCALRRGHLGHGGRVSFRLRQLERRRRNHRARRQRVRHAIRGRRPAS